MDKPLEIAFHGISSSPPIEAEIRDHVEKLEHRFGHLIGCRVAVELLHRQHKTGNNFDVHIEMQVPGGELVVSREPHRQREKYAHLDLPVSLREAFRAAERQLTEYKRRLSGDVRPHEEAFVGQVSQLCPAADHGFILTNEGAQLYFHRNALNDGDFNNLRIGDRVRFTPEDGDTGPMVRRLWRAGEPGRSEEQPEKT
jgi:cold shock CspA family protein/ribosome-associated translation inhibitor RaiA